MKIEEQMIGEGESTGVTRRGFGLLVAGAVGGSTLSGHASAQGNESDGGFLPPPSDPDTPGEPEPDRSRGSTVRPTPGTSGAQVSVDASGTGGQFVADFSNTPLGDDTDASGVALGNISGTVSGVGNVTVAKSDSPGESIGPISGNANDVLTYITIEESGETNTRDATFTFSVRADRLEERGIAPEDAVLYRNDGSGWSELETSAPTAINNGTAYRYTARSPDGFSTFAVARRGVDTSGGETTTTTTEPTTTSTTTSASDDTTTTSASDDTTTAAAFASGLRQEIPPLAVGGGGVFGMVVLAGWYLVRGGGVRAPAETNPDGGSDTTSAEPDESTEETEGASDEGPPADEDDTLSLPPAATSFASACPGVESLTTAETDGPLHTFEGTLVTGEDAVFRVVAPDAEPDGVADEFEAAVRSWRSIDSDTQVASVYESGSEPRPWVAHEPLPGRLLADCLDAPLADRVNAVAAVCETVRNAGRYNVRHRNLTPEHVAVTEDGSVTVSGWGIERVVREHLDPDAPPTRYMAPEEVSDGRVGPHTDVYQLGALAYYAVTGEPPFADVSDAELADVIVGRRPAAPSEFGPECAAFDSRLREAMAPEPADRYTSPHHLRRGLLAAL